MSTKIEIIVDKALPGAGGVGASEDRELPPMRKLALLDSDGDSPVIHYYPVDLADYPAGAPLCCLIGDEVYPVPKPVDELDENRTVSSLEELAHLFEDLELEGYEICQQCESIFDAAELEPGPLGFSYKLIVLADEPEF